MKHLKYALTLTIIGLLVVAVTGIGCRKTLKTGVREIYDDFRSHFDSKDYEAMAEMLTENSLNRIKALGNDDFQAGIEQKLEKDKIFNKAMTIQGTSEKDRTLSGKMIHTPYAYEKAVRTARANANQVELMLKQLKNVKGDKKSELEKTIEEKTAAFKRELDDALQKEGEESVKNAVRDAMNSNKNADIITLRDAIDKALESSKIAKLPNAGHIAFDGSDYRWGLTKLPNKDEWKINIP